MIFNKTSKMTYDLDMDNIPSHIAFIMDGNGRWAKKRNMPRTFGHHEGTKTIRRLALEANRLGVKAMTVYAFSTENFKRDANEVEYIFKLPKEFFDLYLKELIENRKKLESDVLITFLERDLKVKDLLTEQQWKVFKKSFPKDVNFCKKEAKCPKDKKFRDNHNKKAPQHNNHQKRFKD